MEDLRPTYDRIMRQLGEAEGYLTLNMPGKALKILESRTEWATMQFEASWLTGESLRLLDRYREALKPLEVAASLQPGHFGVAIALGWCYKRTQRLAQAIDALDRAVQHNPDVALLHYNLSCYWSLVGNAARSLDELATAFDLDPNLRALTAKESDFDAIRGHPVFEQLTVGPTPMA